MKSWKRISLTMPELAIDLQRFDKEEVLWNKKKDNISASAALICLIMCPRAILNQWCAILNNQNLNLFYTESFSMWHIICSIVIDRERYVDCTLPLVSQNFVDDLHLTLMSTHFQFQEENWDSWVSEVPFSDSMEWKIGFNSCSTPLH